ncbi:MAG TPA: hypothetical protein VHL11_20025 [Phototrophicaceae bacterium]|jgi:hypothetical protein|nr:hypothetical protein [Phototrophicaceae bacterium]
MSDKYSIDQDLREAKAMTDGLDRYLHDDQVYGTVTGGFFGNGNMPALTVGALVMRLRRLHALASGMTDAQRKQLQDIQSKHDAVRTEWRYHYEQKMVREANSRLDAMNAFFDECASDPALCARVYSPEVLRRTTVQELLMVMDDLNVAHDDVTKKARLIDSKLRRVIQPASFVWSENLQSVYPDSQFWWMYNRPPEVKGR